VSDGRGGRIVDINQACNNKLRNKSRNLERKEQIKKEKK
jgi:hypothetical protein